ncbi:toMV susceptible protein tm-1(GCR26) [Trifolium repens]|nr:toMV susceptible protein tm-1(GCR26) [Trifolium repens]
MHRRRRKRISSPSGETVRRRIHLLENRLPLLWLRRLSPSTTSISETSRTRYLSISFNLLCDSSTCFFIAISISNLGFLCRGVLDITTTEVADYIVGGVMACDSSRFDVIIEKKIPLVLSVGALDMVNFGAKDTIPQNFQQRNIYEHNKQVSLMRTTVDEKKKLLFS